MPERPAHNLTPVNPSSRDPLEPGARSSLRARLRGGPAGRAIARLDLRLYRGVRATAREPQLGVVRVFSKCGEHAALWLALGAGGVAVDAPRRGRWGRALGVVLPSPTCSTPRSRSSSGASARSSTTCPR